MSKHSHWASIKHDKQAADVQKSKMFSRLARELTVVAREGGEDPAANARLRMIIEKARDINMPSENIERAVKRGSDKETGAQLKEILLEAYGPGGIALLVQGITDNKNRTLGEIKQTLGKHQGKLVEGGAVRWLFQRKGVVKINFNAQDQNKREDIELAAIEAGGKDMTWQDNTLRVYTEPTELESVKIGLEKRGIAIESASLDWIPKERVELQEQEKILAEKLFEALDENDAVQEVYSNLT